MRTDDLKNRYSNAALNFKIRAEQEERKLLFISILRLLSFISGIAVSVLCFRLDIFIGIAASVLSVALFLFLLNLWGRHSLNKEFLESLSTINQNEATALTGDLSPFDCGDSFFDSGHDFSADVDLFGLASLFQYLNRTVTSLGRDILAGWLADPYTLSLKTELRQEAIRELAQMEKWRHEFMASGFNKPLSKKHINDLEAWMEGGNFVKGSRFRELFIFIMPSITLISLLLLITGVMHFSVFTFFFLLNLLIISFGLKRINEIHKDLSGKHNYLSSIARLFKCFDNESFSSFILNDIKKNISGGGLSASESVRKLNKLIQAFDSRLNIIVSFLLNGFLLWDYHTVFRLEKWKTKYRDLFPVWLQMAGEADAFISLANFTANNENFTFPVLASDGTILSASNLGHPLISIDKRICNDFSLRNKGIICIITGANMAGKSTFLRTIAINYILAMTGAPVCASSMIFSPVMLFTSMRTTDSLSHNESYFYAELKRLKNLKARVMAGEPVLFILDEILKGTNSADKSLGSHLFLKRLVTLGGTGLIATHDISVGEAEKEFPENIINKCFEIEIDGEMIRFDYKLRDGVAFRMNAALLMRQMGIVD